MLRRIFILCFSYGLFDITSSDQLDTNGIPSTYAHCGNLQIQDQIQLRAIAGTWFVIEILQHKIDENYFRGEVLDMESCPFIYVELDALERDLRMLWYEPLITVEYTFKIQERNSPGHWVSTGAQNVTLKESAKYNHFAGFVYVRKAVGDHMVLTFCSPNTELYSVVLSREKWLPNSDLRSITNNMNKNKLLVTQTKRACRNSSSMIHSTIWLLAIFSLIHFILHRFK
ncbi:uncharacterized protein LOC126910430 [Daktulosphaira vitifoliae]|uniref:uncharacterized protein LOC126910430 n=1 Tax=Daktulosphaira vitifoliae TaxID=58002 RepID=UPI0021AAEDA5|nr:uncharacterized protein LOC126910430 [Daktulosphaira vitifoliae]